MPTGNTQQIIDYGTTPNDGTGDPLRTAFIKTDENFDNVWLAGPVGSNVRINNNTISSIDTNGNITIKPDGVGIIQANASIIPNSTNTRDLGSANLVWRRLYVGTLSTTDMTVDGELAVTGNLTVDGDIIQIGNLVTDAKTIQLANTASTDAAADGSGITVGASDDVATLLYNSTTNRWTTNIGLTVGGDIIPSANGVYSLGNSTNYWSNIWVASNTIYIGGVAVGVTGNVLTVDGQPVLSNDSDSTITTTGNITANYFIGDGSLLTGISSTGDFTFANNQMLISNAAMEITAAGTGADVDIEAAEAVFVEALNGEVDIRSSAETYIVTDSGTHVWAFGTDGGLDAPGDINVAGNIVANGTVQGNVITADSAINTAGTIDATGNITAGNIISDGEIISDGRAYVRYLDIRGGEASGTIGQLGYSGNIPGLYGTAGIQIITSDAEGGPTWQFDTAGDLTAPGNITATGNVSADRILTNSLLSDTDVFVQALDGLVDIRANANVVIKSADANYEWVFDTNGVLTTPGGISINGDITGTGSVELQAAPNGNAYVNLDDISDSYIGAAANLYLLADSDNREWIFDTDGTLTTAGDIIVRGDVTGRAAASTLVVKAQPDSNTFIQLNNLVDSTISTAANLEIITDSSNTAQTFAFGTDGSLSVPGNITTGNILTDGYYYANGDPFVSSDYGDSNVVTLLSSFGSNTVSTTGNVSGGNIIAATEVAVDALSITNSSIAAATQFTISTSNTATGNSSSILMDRNGVGVVVQLEDTGGGPYSWGLYQDNILFPDGSRQYSAYGNANVVANLAALGSNPISTTGNVTAGNFIGAGSNVELVAGDYTWTFDNTGNTAFANGTVTATDITLTGNIDANVGGYNIGYREIPQVTLSANANVALADSGKHFYSTTAGNLSLLIPTNANVAFPTGTAFTIVVQAAGNVLVNADSGVNLYLAGNSTAGNRVVSTYGMATVMKVASDTWFINGTGVA